MFLTASGKRLQTHDCGCGNYQLTYQELDPAVAAEEIAAYEAYLVKTGYCLHMANEIENNRFVTYVKGDNMIHCNYFSAMGEFRIIHGPRTWLGPNEPVADYQKIVTPSISIIGMTDNVQCMVVQLCDGTFVVIDGGWSHSVDLTKTLNKGEDNEMVVTYRRDAEADMESLWQFLKDHTPGEGKPQVIWMITHADPDHINLPTRFIRDYSDKFDLKLVCYNFPNMFNIGLGESCGSTNIPANFAAYAAGFIHAARIRFPEAPHYVYHTGQKLYLPGCEIEFLLSPEDFWPNPMPWMNHTSGTWRFTIEGKRILIPGDTEANPGRQMVKVFGDYLKSDVFQPCHHGANCGTMELYEKVAPEVCFWTCQQYHLDYDNRHNGVKPGYEFNGFLRRTARAHYSNTETHRILIPTLEEA